jgi:hypothetical protein
MTTRFNCTAMDNKLKIFLLLSLCITSVVHAGGKATSAEYVSALREVTEVMVEDAISPVAASRYYAYICMAANEAANYGQSGVLISSHLPGGSYGGLHRAVPSDNGVEAVYSVYFMGSKMLPSGYRLFPTLDGFLKKYKSQGFPEHVVLNSMNNAEAICQMVLNVALQDGFRRISGLERYTPLEGDEFWAPTGPAFMQALEPHWGSVQPLLIGASSHFSPKPCISYSAEKTSPFYQAVKDVYDRTGKLSAEEKNIAYFWDCNPFAVQQLGHVEYAVKRISPGGHWMGITGIACLKKKTSITLTTWVHALVAATVMDAFISCWSEKYASNRVRPETAIRKLIDPSWMPLLQTPPFPEYTSGHSVISSAAAEVLSAFFGDKFSYTDTVERGFGLKPRKFSSFREAAEEAAMSRYYGGIHFFDSIENGKDQGRRIGLRIVEIAKVKNLNLMQ